MAGGAALEGVVFALFVAFCSDSLGATLKNRITRSSTTVWVLLPVVLLVGAYFRLAGLGDGGVPGDELEIWRFCESGLSASQILAGKLEHTMSYLFPAWVKALQEMFNLPLSRFSLRLPGALLGIATIIFVYLSGRVLFGNKGGLVAALLLACNPLHIQCSREAYPYVMGVLGAALNLWAILSSARDQWAGRRVAVLSYVALAVGLLLMMHASIASWPVAVVEAAIFFVVQAVFAWRRKKFVGPIITIAMVLIICGPNIWGQIISVIQRGSAKYTQAARHAAPPLFDPKGLTSIYNFAFGNTWVGLAFVAILIVAAILAIWLRKDRRGLLILVVLLFAGFFATMVSRYIKGNPFNPRFLVLLVPAYQLFLCAGILMPLTLPEHRLSKSRATGLTAVLAVLAILLMARPAVHASQLRGNPYNYREIVAWADSHFPRGTPVLCERFFDAFNEFRVNSPTNVVFTATIRNEPLKAYQDSDWRGTAVEFLTNNPDASFYETRMFMLYQEPWPWPAQYFARSRPFIDEHYVKLHALGLNYRALAKGMRIEDMPRTIHYNTVDDLKRKAMDQGSAAFALYGSGWTYNKTGDYRDWRVMQEVATVDVYNVTDDRQKVLLTVFGATPNAAKGIVTDLGQQQKFPENQLSAIAFGPITLVAGKNTVTLKDPAWQSRQVPLFAMKLEVKAAQ